MSEWSGKNEKQSYQPTKKPIPAALAAVTLDVDGSDFDEFKNAINNRLRSITPKNPHYDLGWLFSEDAYEFYSKKNADKTIESFIRDNTKRLTYDAVNNIDITVDLSRIIDVAKFSEVESAIHKFLTEHGVKLKPLVESGAEKRFRNTLSSDTVTGVLGEGVIFLELDPTQKISDLGTKGEVLFNALASLSNAATMANDRNVQQL